jgi:hypothetical protein
MNNPPTNSELALTRKTDTLQKLEAARRKAEAENTGTLINFNEMAESLFIPPKFTGMSGDDSHRWLNKLENYFLVKKIEGDQRAAVLSLLLDSAARDWYEALPDETRGKYDDLLKAFKDRYITSTNTWKEVADIFSKTQKPGEPTLDYIAAKRRMANQAKLPPEQTLQAIITGLDPAIRPFLLQKAPKDLPELEAAAKTIDGSQGTHAAGGSLETCAASLLQAIANIKSDVAELNSKVDTHVTVSAVSTKWNQQSGSNRDRGNYQNHTQRDVNSQGFRGNYQRDNERFSRPGQVQGQRQPCQGCGKFHFRANCPHRETICNFCNIQGHIASVCRKARQQNQNRH